MYNYLELDALRAEEFRLFTLLREEHIFLFESEASDQAHDLGLTYKGRGYWMDDTGLTVARTLKGKLVKLNGNEFDPANIHKSKRASAKANVELARLALKTTMEHMIDFLGIETEKGEPEYKALEKILISTIENGSEQDLSQQFVIFGPQEMKMISKYLNFIEDNPEAWNYKAIKDYTDQKKQSAELPDDEEPVIPTEKPDKKKAAKGLLHKLDTTGSSEVGLNKTLEILTNFLGNPNQETFSQSVNNLKALRDAGAIKKELYRNVSNVMNKILSATSSGEVDAMLGGYGAQANQVYNDVLGNVEAIAPETKDKILASVDAFLVSPEPQTFKVVQQDIQSLIDAGQLDTISATNLLAALMNKIDYSSFHAQQQAVVDKFIEFYKSGYGENVNSEILGTILQVVGPYLKGEMPLEAATIELTKLLDAQQISSEAYWNALDSLTQVVASASNASTVDEPEPEPDEVEPTPEETTSTAQAKAVSVLNAAASESMAAGESYLDQGAGEALFGALTTFLEDPDSQTWLALDNMLGTSVASGHMGKVFADTITNLCNEVPLKDDQPLKKNDTPHSIVKQAWTNAGMPDITSPIQNAIIGGIESFIDFPTEQVMDSIIQQLDYFEDTGKIDTVFNGEIKKFLEKLAVAKGTATSTVSQEPDQEVPGDHSTPEEPLSQGSPGEGFSMDTAMQKLAVNPSNPNYELIQQLVSKVAGAKMNYDIYNIGLKLKQKGVLLSKKEQEKKYKGVPTDELNKKGIITADQWKSLLKYVQNTKGGLTNKYYQYKKGAYYGKNKGDVVAPAKPIVPTKAGPAPLAKTFPKPDGTPTGGEASNLVASMFELHNWYNPPEDLAYFVNGIKQAMEITDPHEATSQLQTLIDEFDVPNFVSDSLKKGFTEARKKLGIQKQTETDVATKNILQSYFGSSPLDQNSMAIVSNYVDAAMKANTSKDAFAQLIKMQDTLQWTDNQVYSLFHFVTEERKKLYAEQPSSLDSDYKNQESKNAQDNVLQIIKNITGDPQAGLAWVTKPQANTLLKAMKTDSLTDFLTYMQEFKAIMGDDSDFNKWMKAALQARPDLVQQLKQIKQSLGAQDISEPEPTPLEKPVADKDIPATPHDFLDTAPEDSEEVFDILTAVKNETGQSIKNLPPETLGLIAQAVATAIDQGHLNGKDGVAKALNDLVGKGLTPEYLNTLGNTIIKQYGWDVTGESPETDPLMIGVPKTYFAKADNLMSTFMHPKWAPNTTIAPEASFPKAMAWLNKKILDAANPEEKQHFENMMKAFAVKFKKYASQVAPPTPAPKPKPAPTVTGTTPAAPAAPVEDPIKKAEGEYTKIKDAEANKILGKFLGDLPKFQQLSTQQRTQLLAAILKALDDADYNTGKYTHLKPLIDKFPGFDYAAYDHLRNIFKPVFSDPTFKKAKGSVAAILQAKKDAEEVAKEKAYYQDLYGDVPDPKISAYTEPQTHEPAQQRINHVFKNWIHDIGFGPGQIPPNERKKLVTTVQTALGVPQAEILPIMKGLMASTSLHPKQIAALVQAVHKERQDPQSLAPKQKLSKSDKNTMQGKDLFAPKFKLAQLDPEKAQQAKTVLQHIISTPNAGQHEDYSFLKQQRIALMQLGVPFAVANRWAKWADKVRQSGGTLDKQGRVVMGNQLAQSVAGDNLAIVPQNQDPWGLINKVNAPGETVKMHPNGSSTTAAWTLPSHDSGDLYKAQNMAYEQKDELKKTLPPKLHEAFMQARGQWQGSGQWGHSVESRKQYNALFTKIIEGPPKKQFIQLTQHLERGFTCSIEHFSEFIKAFAVDKPVYLGPSGFTENRHTARNAAHPSDGNVAVLLAVLPSKQGMAKGIRLQAYDHQSENEIITGTSPTLVVKNIIKHIIKKGYTNLIQYEIQMQETDQLNEGLDPTSYWKGLDRNTIKMLIKYLNSSVHTRYNS